MNDTRKAVIQAFRAYIRGEEFLVKKTKARRPVSLHGPTDGYTFYTIRSPYTLVVYRLINAVSLFCNGEPVRESMPGKFPNRVVSLDGTRGASTWDYLKQTTLYCYQCDNPTAWLAPDSRCGDCTRYTPDEIKGN